MQASPELHWKPQFNTFKGGGGWSLVLPIWIPFLTVAFPTVALWWFDRRRIPPGHCRKCGYNLTGNVSGVCPECGERV